MSERSLIALVVGFVLCGGARADLLVGPTFDFQDRPLVSASSDLESRITDISGPVHTLSVREWEPLNLSPEPRYNLNEPTPVLPVQVSSDSGPSSLSLCLSALVSLGLYSSAHSLKRGSLGLIPHGYHNAGPFQIGHSIAVDLDSASPIPVCCFVQPVPGAEDTVPHYRFGTVMSLWRTSQYTPDLLAARGPPVTC